MGREREGESACYSDGGWGGGGAGAVGPSRPLSSARGGIEAAPFGNAFSLGRRLPGPLGARSRPDGARRGRGGAEGAPEWQTLMQEGYLLKKSPSLFGGWQKRYVRLYNNGIAYYNANASSVGEESGLLGFLHIDGIENVETTEESFRVRAFCQKRGPGRDYEFKADANGNITEWIDKMQDLVNSKPSS